jgi:hypothetical protein
MNQSEIIRAVKEEMGEAKRNRCREVLEDLIDTGDILDLGFSGRQKIYSIANQDAAL